MHNNELKKRVDIVDCTNEKIEEQVSRMIHHQANCNKASWEFKSCLLNEVSDMSINSIVEKSLRKKIRITDVNFPNTFNTKIFMKIKEIEFNNCQFNSVIDLGLNQNVTVKFNKCNFYEDWSHIEVDEVLYSKCNFKLYEHNNSSENKDTIKNLLFYDCNFGEIDISGAILEKRLFKFSNTNKYYKIEKLKFEGCEFKEDFILVSQSKENKRFFINEINLEHSQFNKKVKIQFCDIEKGDFYNTKFKDLADFYQSKFNKVNFERTDFEGIAVFSEVEFTRDVFFKYTKFLSSTVFRDTVIGGKLDLRDSISGNQANMIFLDITSKSRKKELNHKIEFVGEPSDINVANRETARLIKSSYDNANNIIEANRFYKLEMIEKEKELKRTKTKPPLEWLVFKIHGMTSNHSQDWLLAFFWIINIGLIASLFNFYTIQDENLNYIHSNLNSLYTSTYLIITTIFTAYCLTYSNKIFHIILFIGFYLIYKFVTTDSYLTEFANVINPFSIMTKGDTLNLGMLIFKIIIAYLMYQFIVSVRQNTRRK